MSRMKITTTAQTLKKCDKVGRRVVRYSTPHELGHCHMVYFEDSEIAERYGRNEPITVELSNPGGWYLRRLNSCWFWHPKSDCFTMERGESFLNREAAVKFSEEEIERCPETKLTIEVVFLV